MAPRIDSAYFIRNMSMRAGIIALTLFSIALSALAGCPNLCSGHGSCASSDICMCHHDWQGADCSLRTCAFGRSWARDAADPHSYEECSGQGICDRCAAEWGGAAVPAPSLPRSIQLSPSRLCLSSPAG